jgi:hypothetical protein
LKAYYSFENQREFLPAKFFSYSAEEVSIEFRTRIDELERTSSLTLLSSAETSKTKPDLAGSKENLPGQNQVWTLLLTCQVLF